MPGWATIRRGSRRNRSSSASLSAAILLPSIASASNHVELVGLGTLAAGELIRWGIPSTATRAHVRTIRIVQTVFMRAANRSRALLAMKPARDGPPVLVVAWLPGMLCSPFLLLCNPTLLVGIDLVSPGIRYRARSAGPTVPGRPHARLPAGNKWCRPDIASGRMDCS